ncbi:MAG: extracellular solute-binding protein [Campylobacteraceae bacterium]|nr:extracellular solute-binding protein [Campylobacteraceae bacterium]
MKNLLKLALAGALITGAFAKTELTVSYTYAWFTELQEKLKEEFEKENPDITIKLQNPTVTYEDNAAKLLREKVVNKLPDVAFISFNYLDTMKSKEIPLPLNEYFTEEDVKDGFTKEMFRPTTIDGTIYAVPFAASLPVVYYNMDLVKQAGWNKELPSTWEEAFELSNAIRKIDGKHGFYFAEYTGSWLQMALIMSYGGEFVKDGKIGFNNEIGKEVYKLMSEFNTVAGAPAISDNSAKQSFAAGNIGVYVASSAALVSLEKAVGNNFEMRAHKFPGVKENGQLPVGGSIAMLTSDKNRDAALKYIKYVTGKIGNAYIPQYTGYMSVNKLTEETLADFYVKNPNQQVAPSQLDLMGPWPTLPGDNALKAADIIYNYSIALFTGERKDHDKVLEEVVEKVNALLP